MKKLLIFLLSFWSVTAFSQSAMFGVLKNGHGTYYGRNHLADGKYTLDTSGTKILFDDTYYIAGTFNSQNSENWRVDVNGVTLNAISAGHAKAATVGGPPNGNTFGSTLVVPILAAYLDGVDVLLSSPFTSKEAIVAAAPDSIVMGVISSVNSLVNVYEKIDINRVTFTTRLYDTTGLPPPSVLLVQYSGSNSTGQVVNSSFVTNQTVADLTGTVQGIQNVVKLSHTSLAALATEGISSTIYHTGAGTSVSIRAFQANIINTSASANVTQSIGFYYPGAVVSSAGSFTDDYGLYLDAANAGGGVITRRWGIFQIDALAKNRFDGKILLNNVVTGSGTPNILVHLNDSTVGQMPYPAGASASSGSFTPSLTNTTNISASTLNQASYIKVGNVVQATVSGTLTSTDGTNVCILTIDLPFSTSTTFQDAVASGSVNLWTGFHGVLIGIIPLLGLVSNGTQFQIKCFPTTTTVSDFSVTIQYHTD